MQYKPKHPTGLISFLLTDIEGSTQLWEEHPQAMERALARHDELLLGLVKASGGYVFSKAGDSFGVAFQKAADAAGTAANAQLALAAEPWPRSAEIRVRMAVHSGLAEERDGDYFGPTVNRAGRLRAAAHGGQTVVSRAAVEAVGSERPGGIGFRDLGQHRLRDLSRSEHVFQLLHPSLRTDFPPLNVLDRFPNNLPVQLTSLIGRQRDLERVTELLPSSRLLTLSGVGGCGKTRLGLQVAADVLEDYPDGVWFVDLAPVADPALVPQTMASALSVQEEPGRALIDSLVAHLEVRTVLLVLDNCEHLIEPVARIADTLLQRCPSLRIMATSREGLGITGEQAYPVSSLELPEALPDPVSAQSLRELAQCESIRLFHDRAVMTKPTFRITVANAPSVFEICHRLDGIPLAIELAAARVRVLPVERIRNRLDDSFRLLTGGSRTALPRQQTLRAAIDWSHDLLEEPERLLFRRLASFRGSWSLQAAEAICSGDGLDDWEVLDLLERLVDKSLAITDDQGGEVRYRMLQTIGQYASEKLNASGENPATRDRHLDYFLAMAREAASEIRGVHQAEWLDRLDADHDNLRAAIDWASGMDRPGKGLSLTVALWRFWYMRGYWAEGQRRLALQLARPGVDTSSTAYAEGLNRRANLLAEQGDIDGASLLYEESLGISRKANDPHNTAACLNNLGITASNRGDFPAAYTYFEESSALFRETGNRLGVANSLNNLASVAADVGEYDEARKLYEECLTISRELADPQAVANSLNNLGEMAHLTSDFDTALALCDESLKISRDIGDDRLVAMVLTNLGAVARKQGDLVEARRLYEESLRIRRTLGHRLGVAESIEDFCRIAAVMGNCTQAAQLLGAADALRGDIQSPLPPGDRQRLDVSTAQCRERLGATAFEAACEEGRGMNLNAAVEYALTGAAAGDDGAEDPTIGIA